MTANRTAVRRGGGANRTLDQRQRLARCQFGRNSANYGRSHILADTRDICRVLAGVRIPPRAEALDIATGGGHTAVFLARMGCQVTASDLARPMLQQAKQLAAEEGLRITVRQHSAEDLPYAANRFDFVSCRVAAHHFTRPARFIREAARVLRPGGYFLLIDGVSPDDEPKAAQWLHRVEKLRDPSHGRFLAPRRWKKLCQRHGLRVRKLSVTRLRQPDLRWYFETASTSASNRAKVLRMVKNAPPEAERVFQLKHRGEIVSWNWLRMGLLAVA